MAYVPNFKWTVADTDRIVKMARRGYTCGQIAKALNTTPVEIRRICEDAHQFVRHYLVRTS